MKTFSLLAILIAVFILNISNATFSNGNSISSDSNYIEQADPSVTAEYCPVSGEKIEGSGVVFNYLDTKVKFCCEGCEKSFKKNPAKYLKAGVIDPVCGMTETNSEITTVNDGVKYYFCSESCKNKFEKDPSVVLEKYNK